MPRPSIGDTPMTGAERQARYRAMHANGEHIRFRRTVDRRSRIQRWYDTIAGLTDLQEEYAAWLDALPANQQDSAMAEALRAIVDLDLSELQAIEPPRGFGRD
jgi:thioester reductase-like protein